MFQTFHTLWGFWLLRFGSFPSPRAAHGGSPSRLRRPARSALLRRTAAWRTTPAPSRAPSSPPSRGAAAPTSSRQPGARSTASPSTATGSPPTLQGFFYGGGDGAGPGSDGDGDGSDEEEGLPPPRQDYGKFVSLPGASAAAPPIDPTFSFLTNKLFGTNHIFLLDSCNGLLLFGHIRAKNLSLGYIVCNPATEQWTAVPGCRCWHDKYPELSIFSTRTYLVFDPAVSSHFHLVLFWEDEDEDMATVHTYSSETGEWSHSETDWTEEERQGPVSIAPRDL
ncbi:hypothetical protein ACP70R_014738 [Stipagrostis hirtigluma subsp. patula]